MGTLVLQSSLMEQHGMGPQSYGMVQMPQQLPPLQAPQFAAPPSQQYAPAPPTFSQTQPLVQGQQQQLHLQPHLQPKGGQSRSFQQGLKPTRRGGKKRGGKNRWQAGRQVESGAPSLASLSAQNRQRTQRHFGGQEGSDPPRTVPHAPRNDNTFLFSQYGRRVGAQQLDSPALMTPSQPIADNMLWTPARADASEYSSLDKDAADLGAQLDFFGTNEGLVARYSSDDNSSDGGGNSDSEAAPDQEHGWHLRADDSSGAAADAGSTGLPAHVKSRLASQSAYIQQLEQQNLDLQEKYSLLQHELQELKAVGATGTSGPAVEPESNDPAAQAPATDEAPAAAASTADG